MIRRILKWPVPIDDRFHPIGRGPVVHVGVQNAEQHLVVVWTDEINSEDVVPRAARVYGTGQPLPAHDEHVGSTIDGPLVWHVLVNPEPPGTDLRVVDGGDES